MLFKCLPPGAQIPGRFPGPMHARGKWFTIDIHCHVRSDKAAAMVEGNTAVSQWFLETAASEHSRIINRQNGERTRLQGSSPEQRILDMDRMGIDIQAIFLRRARPTMAPTPISGARPRAPSTISSPRSAAVTPTVSSASAQCRFRPPISRSPSSTDCTNRWGFTASRS